MIEIFDKKECCGCYSCINICPNKCIIMKSDREGFEYPEIDKNKCINCKLCEKTCPQINEVKKNKFLVETYAGKNRDESIRLNSSSGGIFFKLCEYVINNNGVVFGAAFDENLKVNHSYAESLNECEKFRGSKYVQSSIGDTYKKAKEFLDIGRLVLFSGTQCQIKGLNLYLMKDYKNLICVDIICHGVPSPLILDKYVEKKKKQYGGKIKEYNFRDKYSGWENFSTCIKFDNGKQYKSEFINDNYMKGFLKDLYLRPSCYECKSKNFTNKSDISLADYWGIKNIHPEFDDDKGVSLILINSEKGKSIFYSISKDIEYLESDLNFAIQNNPCIVRSVSQNKNREKFFNLINKNDIEKAIIKCIKDSYIKKLMHRIKVKLSIIKSNVLKLVVKK